VTNFSTRKIFFLEFMVELFFFHSALVIPDFLIKFSIFLEFVAIKTAQFERQIKNHVIFPSFRCKLDSIDQVFLTERLKHRCQLDAR